MTHSLKKGEEEWASLTKPAAYTYFGEVFDSLVRSRGYSQSQLAAEMSALAASMPELYEVRQYRQNSISQWMQGLHGCPRDVPSLLDEILVLTKTERRELALAYAYGQRMTTEEFRRFWESRRTARVAR